MNTYTNFRLSRWHLPARHIACRDANAWLLWNERLSPQKTATVFNPKLLQFSIQNCYSFSPSIKDILEKQYARVVKPSNISS